MNTVYKLANHVFDQLRLLTGESKLDAYDNEAMAIKDQFLALIEELDLNEYKTYLQNSEDQDIHGLLKKAIRKQLINNKSLQKNFNIILNLSRNSPAQKGVDNIILSGKNFTNNSTINAKGDVHIGDKTIVTQNTGVYTSYGNIKMVNNSIVTNQDTDSTNAE